MRNVAAILAGAALLSACVGPFRDRANDYRQSVELPAPKTPEGLDARPLRDLYAVPAERVKPEWPKKFDVPAPKPLVLEGDATPSSAPLADVRWQLLMGQDGNGYPLLTIRGAGFDQAWDQLDRIVQDLKLPVEDKNRSLAMIYLKLADDVSGKKKVAVKGQLKLTRGVDSWQLTVQKDDDNLAPVDESRVLLEKIMAAWQKPAAPVGGDK